MERGALAARRPLGSIQDHASHAPSGSKANHSATPATDAQLSPRASSSSLAISPVAEPYGVAPGADAEVGYPIAAIYAKMKAMEDASGRAFNPGARYLKHRRVLVDWICEVGEDHKLHPSTMHVAIGYMDRFLQTMDVHRSRLQLVAMACVVVAAKYEEEEVRVPDSATINSYANNSYPPKMVHQMEVLLLNRLGWCLTCVTPLHYLGVFQRQGYLFSDDSMAYKPLVPKAVRYAKKYLEFFADLCIQDYTFQRYPPSLLAAAIVVAARKALIMRPVWNPALTSLLRYEQQEIAPVFRHIWWHYEQTFPQETAATATSAQASDLEALAAGIVAPDQLALFTDISGAEDWSYDQLLAQQQPSAAAESDTSVSSASSGEGCNALAAASGSVSFLNTSAASISSGETGTSSANVSQLQLQQLPPPPTSNNNSSSNSNGASGGDGPELPSSSHHYFHSDRSSISNSNSLQQAQQRPHQSERVGDENAFSGAGRGHSSVKVAPAAHNNNGNFFNSTAFSASSSSSFGAGDTGQHQYGGHHHSHAQHHSSSHHHHQQQQHQQPSLQFSQGVPPAGSAAHLRSL